MESATRDGRMTITRLCCKLLLFARRVTSKFPVLPTGDATGLRAAMAAGRITIVMHSSGGSSTGGIPPASAQLPLHPDRFSGHSIRSRWVKNPRNLRTSRDAGG